MYSKERQHINISRLESTELISTNLPLADNNLPFQLLIFLKSFFNDPPSSFTPRLDVDIDA
jgi:hypothetical protein